MQPSLLPVPWLHSSYTQQLSKDVTNPQYRDCQSYKKCIDRKGIMMFFLYFKNTIQLQQKLTPYHIKYLKHKTKIRNKQKSIKLFLINFNNVKIHGFSLFNTQIAEVQNLSVILECLLYTTVMERFGMLWLFFITPFIVVMTNEVVFHPAICD